MSVKVGGLCLTKEKRAMYRGRRCEKFIALYQVADHINYSSAHVSLYEFNLRNLPQEVEAMYCEYIDNYEIKYK